jgi:hypothetical protein
MRTFQTHTLVSALALLLYSALAVPNVTVVPLESNRTCSSYPGWMQPSTPDAPDTTRYINFQVDQADDAGANGLVTSVKTIDFGNSTLDTLYVDFRKSRALVITSYRCINGVVGLGSGGDPPISVSKDRSNAFLQLTSGYKLGPYAHTVNGTRQDGVFIGAQNQTTWGFSYVLSNKCGENDYYEVKLLGLPDDPNFPPTAARPVDFKGFLKAIEW